VRTAATWVLDRTLASGASVEPYLAATLSHFDERDRALLHELVLGTLRWLRRLDQVIGAASHRAFDDIEEGLRSPLRIAAYQLLFLDRVPAHAAVDEAVTQAHRVSHRGGAAFVNAVLRRIARSPCLEEWPIAEPDPMRRLAIETSHPDFLVERWWRRFGEARTRELVIANNRPKPVHLLAFRDRGGREMLAESLIDEGLEMEPSILSPLGLLVRKGDPLATAAFARGDFYVQDEASQVAAWIPLPASGETVLDAAAAPGGKSFALLAREPGVYLVAGDLAPARVATFAANCARLGRRVPLLAADATRPPLSRRFARVVLDLPCTGTGTLRKHPDLKWRITPGEIGRLANRAVELLAGAAGLVAPGGVLSAITCSLEEEENEEVGRRFLATHPDFATLPLAERIEPAWAPGVEAPGRWRMLPADEHDGFTVQVFERRA
jgi:16S rRNA (cytosine967-C5)-methyltransferase